MFGFATQVTVSGQGTVDMIDVATRPQQRLNGPRGASMAKGTCLR